MRAEFIGAAAVVCCMESIADLARHRTDRLAHSDYYIPAMSMQAACASQFQA